MVQLLDFNIVHPFFKFINFQYCFVVFINIMYNIKLYLISCHLVYFQF
jgi:hypothetical protein